MTVKVQQGSRYWRSALQRGIDTASEYADVAAQKLSAVSDPRARLLRKRRWALRLGLFFGFASVFWTLVTGLLATWSTPVWALLITGLVAAGRRFRQPCGCCATGGCAESRCRHSVRSAAGGCRHWVRRPARRCLRWAPPSAGCIRCWESWTAERCCRPRRSGI